MFSHGTARPTRSLEKTRLEKSVSTDMNTPGAATEALKKLRSCIVRELDPDYVPTWGGTCSPHHPFTPFPRFFIEDLELFQPCHFLGILKSNPIAIESSCEKDWFADADCFFATRLLPRPRLPEDRRDGAFVIKRDCAVVLVNDPWIERGVYQSRVAVCIVAYLRPKVPHRTRVLPL